SNSVVEDCACATAALVASATIRANAVLTRQDADPLSCPALIAPPRSKNDSESSYSLGIPVTFAGCVCNVLRCKQLARTTYELPGVAAYDAVEFRIQSAAIVCIHY